MSPHDLVAPSQKDFTAAIDEGVAGLYQHDFLDAYMRMVEDTESPRVFHLWSALTCISACLGRRNFLPFGSSQIYPNLFTLLVGSAAGRKSTAMLTASRLLRDATNIRFAQDDCAGKKQGIVGMLIDEDETDEGKEIESELESFLTIQDLSKVTISTSKQPPAKEKHLVHNDNYFAFITASEFTNFTGHGNSEFLTFLGKMYDGEPYDYRLKKKSERMVMDNPLLALIGCTTPTLIAEAFPPAAIGQGFMSRLILVHGTKKYKRQPRPRPFDTGLQDFIKKRFSDIYYSFEGEFSETPGAVRFTEQIYDTKNDLTDGRFSYYLERRGTHLLKLGMVIAAARASREIHEEDYYLADIILRATEKHMPDALGEFGMSPIAAAKQRILEYITAAREPLSINIIHAFTHRDLRINDLSAVLTELIHLGKIKFTRSEVTGEMVYYPVLTISPEELALMDMITNAPTTETAN